MALFRGGPNGAAVQKDALPGRPTCRARPKSDRHPDLSRPVLLGNKAIEVVPVPEHRLIKRDDHLCKSRGMAYRYEGNPEG